VFREMLAIDDSVAPGLGIRKAVRHPELAYPIWFMVLAL
jgi:hypothetical protein